MDRPRDMLDPDQADLVSPTPMSLGDLRLLIKKDHQAKGKRSDRLTVDIYRIGQYTSAKRSRVVLHAVYRAVDMLWTRMIVGAEIPPSVKAGPGLRIRHWGRGVILHPDVRLGTNVNLYHRVTLGIGSNGGVPTLGDHVYVGAGATIIGGIRIGDRVRIGAGTVVTKDVPDDAVVVGPPARILEG